MTKNAISFFLRETIVQAGALAHDQCKAHDVRAISASASFWSNWSLTKVLEATSWKSNNVFADCYLKDVMLKFDNHMSFGLFTTAGLAVHRHP